MFIIVIYTTYFTYSYLYKYLYYTLYELAHLIMEAKTSTICHLQAEGPGKLEASFSLIPKACESRAQVSQDRRWMSQLKKRANSPFLCLRSLLSLPIQMPVSSRNTLRDTPPK